MPCGGRFELSFVVGPCAAEFTGSHTQFYDKFMFRSLTAQLLEHLWTLTPYRESIIRYSQDRSK